MQWEQWQVEVTIATSIISALVHLSIAAALFSLWMDKREGMPYSSVLLLLSAWLGLSAVVHGAWVTVAYVPAFKPYAWYLPIIYVMRSSVGVPAAIGVWYAVAAATRFAPPIHAQNTIRALKWCLSDSIRVEERRSNGTDTRHAIADGPAPVLAHGSHRG